MKKYMLSCAALLGSVLLMTSLRGPVQPDKGFTVTGHINGLPDGEIYLAYGSFGTMKADTVVAKNGDFTFKGIVGEPCYGMLFTHTYSVKMDLFVDNALISIKGSMDSAYDYHVTGNAVVNEYAAYNQAHMDLKKPVQGWYEKWIEAHNAGDSAGVEKYKAAFNAARDVESKESRVMVVTFIKEHPHSAVSVWELVHYVSNPTLDESTQLFAGLDKGVQESKQGKEVAERIATLKSIGVGKMAPLFAQNDVDGKPVTLASYKGKYVLVEFWASWCGPCRAESPNLKKEYVHYNPKGFNVLSVSLDDKKDKWLEAIRKDDLPWTQVSDLKGWKNEVAALYGIHGVPANFLIDPSGKIVAQDLRGEALGVALAKLYHE